MKQAQLIPSKFYGLTAALAETEEPSKNFTGFRLQRDELASTHLTHPETGVPYPIAVVVGRRPSGFQGGHTVIISVTVVSDPLGKATNMRDLAPHLIYCGTYENNEGLVEALDRFIAAYQDCFIYEDETDAEDEGELVMRHWLEDNSFSNAMFAAVGLHASSPWFLGTEEQPILHTPESV